MTANSTKTKNNNSDFIYKTYSIILSLINNFMDFMYMFTLISIYQFTNIIKENTQFFNELVNININMSNPNLIYVQLINEINKIKNLTSEVEAKLKSDIKNIKDLYGNIKIILEETVLVESQIQQIKQTTPTNIEMKKLIKNLLRTYHPDKQSYTLTKEQKIEYTTYARFLNTISEFLKMIEEKNKEPPIWKDQLFKLFDYYSKMKNWHIFFILLIFFSGYYFYFVKYYIRIKYNISQKTNENEKLIKIIILKCIIYGISVWLLDKIFLLKGINIYYVIDLYMYYNEVNLGNKIWNDTIGELMNLNETNIIIKNISKIDSKKV